MTARFRVTGLSNVAYIITLVTETFVKGLLIHIIGNDTEVRALNSSGASVADAKTGISSSRTPNIPVLRRGPRIP